jgi:hypothetical protein
MKALRSFTAVTALGLFTLAGVTGCHGVLNRLEDGLDHADPITEVTIDGGGGDVTVSTDPTVSGVEVRRSVQYLTNAPSKEDTITFNGGVLKLKTDCGTNCSASYVVRTGTKGVKVTGDNGSGDLHFSDVSDVDIKVGSGNVDIRNATGSVRLRAGSGDVDLSDIDGAVSVNTGSGNITGDDLRGSDTVLDVSSGDITLHVPGTGNVKATTGSGNVEIWVPDNTSRVKVDTGSGDESIDVAQQPTSAYLIDVHTGSGDVKVRSGV